MGLISTGQTPLWLVLVGEETSLSYIDLATDERWRDYFYTNDREWLEGCCAGLLGYAMPIRRDVIDNYTKQYDNGTVAIERRFPHETYDETLPNIVELAMWWIARTKDNGGNHGLSTNHKTPSSTRSGEGMLCLEFVRYEFLDVNVNKPKYVVVSPGE